MVINDVPEGCFSTRFLNITVYFCSSRCERWLPLPLKRGWKFCVCVRRIGRSLPPIKISSNKSNCRPSAIILNCPNFTLLLFRHELQSRLQRRRPIIPAWTPPFCPWCKCLDRRSLNIAEPHLILLAARIFFMRREVPN